MSTYNKKDVSDGMCITALNDAELENVFGGGGAPYGAGLGSGFGSGLGASTANALSNNSTPFFPPSLTPIVIVNTNANEFRRRRRRHHDDFNGDDFNGFDGDDGGDW